MQAISPAAFYRTFLDAAAEHGNRLLDASTIGNATFTDVMFMNVISTVAARLGCCWFREYYTFDAVFYNEKDTNHFPESTTYVKNIAIALEHENLPKKSVEEIHKLQLLNAPLKVLVTYPLDHEHVQLMLHTYAEIISEADVFGDISTLRRQLVIFGFVEGRAFSWRAFVYKDGTFVEVEPAAVAAA